MTLSLSLQCSEDEESSLNGLSKKSEQYQRASRKKELIIVAANHHKRCKSEPQINFIEQHETFSICSVPVKHTPWYTENEEKEMRRSVSEIGLKKNCESESDLSIGDLLHVDERIDPLVVFWEKSDKKQHIESTVIVKFILEAGEVFTHTFLKTSKVAEVKQIIADMFKVPVHIVQLKHHTAVLEDNMSISDVAIERFGSVTFQLTSLDPNWFPLVLNNVYPDIPTNDVLTVVVHKGSKTKEVIVEIENRVILKPFIGGYRHKITKVEYHHAFTQTAPKASKTKVLSRTSQTPGINKSIDTSKDELTQTSQTHPEQDRVCNTLMGSSERRRIQAEEEARAFQDKVVLIQRNLRSWLVRKMMLKMKEEYKRCITWEKNERNKMTRENEDRVEELENAINKPKSRGDFELLYHRLEEWRQREIERINSMGSVAVRKAELCSALELEIQMINSIERHRVMTKQEIQKDLQESFLEKTASPLQWKGSRGQVLCMDSLGTQRAREMRNMYLSLQRMDLSSEERIVILREAKQNLLKHGNALVPELLSLLDRECCVLTRNMINTNLSTLRNRILFLFLELSKDPQVNPEASKYLPEELCQKTQMYKCLSCQNIFPFFKFRLHSKANDFRRCINCTWLREIGGPRIDVNPIRHILNAVRREELYQSLYTSVALVMQEHDFYHLIVNIWLGHSAIGGSGNLEELRLGRWDFTQNWSPWNCILLTKEELKAHLRFSNPEQIYSFSFVKKIKQRHQIARIHFSELASHSLKPCPVNFSASKILNNYNAGKIHLGRKNSSQRNL